MKLSAIEPGNTGQDLRTFTCQICKTVQVHTIESIVTEAWLEPQHAIKGRHEHVITHGIHDRHIIPK